MRSPQLYPAARALRAAHVLSLGLASLTALAALASCAGSSEDPPADGPSDAPMDGPPKPRVQAIDPCPTSVAVEIIEVREGAGFNYSPNPATIQAGQVVRFRLSGEHNARSGSVFRTNPGKTECFRFNQKETLLFACDAHGFTGRLIVQ